METATDIQNIMIQTANSQQVLIKDLAHKIQNSFKQADLVFKPAHIVAPNRAQFQWLKEELAQEMGFIANLEYQSLNSFFTNLIKELKPELKDAVGKEKLIWQLFSALGKKEFREQFKKIAEYCGEDELKRLALAQKVSGLFEDYQQYDPELIQKWKAKSWEPQEEQEQWQAYLFQAAGYDKNFISSEEFKMLAESNKGIINEYRFLFIFGAVSFSPLHLEYLKILGDIDGFDVFMYRYSLNGDAEKNPLAQNWGELTERTAKQLNSVGEINKSEEPELPTGSLLNQLQQDILKDQVSGNLPQDDSVLIYNSFTKVREVEALYNYLVKTVDEALGKLGARDIAVYVPNLDPYIPAIKTVFDSAPYKFPYTLVSKSFSREESLWTALEQILSFEEEDFTAPKVFNLLELQPIQNSFGFIDLDLLRKAFKDANIRREYEGDEHLETNFASFSYGLQRLIYGFCLGSEEPVELADEKIWPVDIAEGQQAYDLFRLYHLVESLNELVQIKQERRKASDWQKEMMKIANQFLKPEEWQEKQFMTLMENLISLEASEEEIAFKTIYHRLKDKLENKDLQEVKGRGGIVFSGLYSGVSMPKKVMAFLGLNFKEFPKKSTKLSFDLLEENKKPTGRSEDRAAFLQTLLNAEEKILLSYIGQNVKDNSEIPASSLISELQEYAEKGGVKIKEVKHALHAFNSAYFKQEYKDLFTYTGSGQGLGWKQTKNTVEGPEEIHLNQLTAFLKDPFKHHYNKVLGIYYENPEVLPDWECFELGNIEEWKVKDRLKAVRIKDEEVQLEELRQKFLLNSELPLKNIGRSILTETEKDVKALWEKVEEIRNGKPIEVLEDTLSVELKTGQTINLKIALDLIGEDSLFLIVSKKGKLKYEFSAYIQALTHRALGGNGKLHYFCFDGKEPYHQEVQFELSPEEAMTELKYFVRLLFENYERLIPFYPELGLKVEDLKECEDDEEKEKTETIKELIDSRFDDNYGFFPSDYFLREYEQGFFNGVEGEARLLELQQKTIEITEKVNNAFNKNN